MIGNSTSLGEKTITPSEGDLEQKERWFRQIVADQDIAPGEKLTREKLAAKRPPGEGISPKHFECLIGLTINITKEEDEPIHWDDLQ